MADSVKMHQNVVDGYVTFVEELNGKYSGNTLPKDASEFFSQIDADVQALVEKTKKFVGDNKIFVAYYKNKVTGLSAEKQGKLNTLIEKVSECVGKLEQSADLKALQQNIQNLLSGVQLDDAALVFTEKVKQFDFKNLPTQTELLLENAGVRKSGDKLVFKLAVVSKENKEPEVIEARVFNLFMVVPHLRTTVYLAFADHFGSEDDGLTDKKFVPAPSYSILFKGFDKCIRRKNVFYNRFVDPGIGVHFAYLNFDDNAAPELGLGGNISLFRDFFQVGGGYNVGLNVGYWFFGVKFPFLNMTMPVDGNKPVWGGI